MTTKPKATVKPKTSTNKRNSKTQNTNKIEKEVQTKPSTKLEKRETTENVKVIAHPTNELVERVEKGEKIFFRWNGETIIGNSKLEYKKCYEFDKLHDRSKVTVLSKFNKKRKVIADKYQGRAGILLKDGYTIRDTMTPREIASLPRVDNGTKIRDLSNPLNLRGEKDTVRGQAPVPPHVVVDVVQVISEQEYRADDMNEFKVRSASIHTRHEDRVE